MEYLAVILFAITTYATPGPNNTMLMTSGLNYGIQRSLPHYLGIILGFPTMVIAVGLDWQHCSIKSRCFTSCSRSQEPRI